jgi:DNA repair photolyase
MHYEDFKTIVSPQNGLNLYRGCTHGCIYCDSRSRCYQIQHDFEDIAVKREAPAILAGQLKKRRQPAMISTGAMSDPYNPLEKELGLTRQCLEVIRDRGFGVTVLTKSSLVLRDLDLLAEINSRTRCVVQMTLTSFDEELAGRIEPRVSSTRERFETLLKFKAAGVPAAVWFCPILPLLNDTEENVRGILDYCLEAGVKGIMLFNFGLTMREGSRDYLYRCLDRLFPGLKEQYIKMYGNRYECLSPRHRRLSQIFEDVTNKAGIINKTDEMFKYLRFFEVKNKERTLF